MLGMPARKRPGFCAAAGTLGLLGNDGRGFSYSPIGNHGSSFFGWRPPCPSLTDVCPISGSSYFENGDMRRCFYLYSRGIDAFRVSFFFLDWIIVGAGSQSSFPTLHNYLQGIPSPLTLQSKIFLRKKRAHYNTQPPQPGDIYTWTSC